MDPSLTRAFYNQNSTYPSGNFAANKIPGLSLELKKGWGNQITEKTIFCLWTIIKQWQSLMMGFGSVMNK